MPRMTQSQALDLIENTFDTAPDSINPHSVEVTLYDMTVEQARADMDSFCAFIGAELDEKSITLTADTVEDASVPATRLVIQTEGG